MEKIIYTLFDAKHGSLRSDFPKKLQQAGASSLRINICDDAVASAAPSQQSRTGNLPNAVVQCWVPSANPALRNTLDDLIDSCCESFHAWLTVESEIIPNDAHPTSIGERTHGFAQMAFLTLPENMQWEDWRKIWRDGHTQVAIDTQSNFEYTQNLIVEPLTDDASPFVAIVEECFPIEAMTDPFVFFDAAGDQEKFDRNLAAMMESCARFITPGTIDVFATSQYNFG